MSFFNNLKISEIFRKMAFLCELEGENPFKIRAYIRAADLVESLDRDISEMSDDELLSTKGIGKGILQHIKDILVKGSFDEYERLSKKYPSTLFELNNIPGLGAKRIKILYQRLSVDTKEKLYKAAKNGDIEKLDGFGLKIQNSIIEAIEKNETTPKRFLISVAEKSAVDLINFIKGLGYKNVEYAGSLRRGKETIGDIDIVVCGDENAASKISKYPYIKKVIAEGSTKVSFILSNNMQCDVRIVKEESFGAAMCYFTGSKEHNIALRELAQKKGYLLNEYGLFKKGENKPFASKTEHQIYSALGLQYIPPELRENEGEIELAEKNMIPVLVDFDDIKGDIHCHTTMTDGTMELEDIVYYLKDLYEWFLIGDHSAPLNFVHGLDYKQYMASRKKLLELSNKYRNVLFDRSIELEILKDGSLAFKDEELDNVALTICAAHTSTKMKKDEITGRMLKAISNPYCDVVAHLSQRLLFQREEIDMDYDLIFEKAFKYSSVFEVNGQPDRLDLNEKNIKKIKKLGLKVILTSDAHSKEQFSYIKFALKIARRAGLTKNDVLNSYSYRDFINFILENRRRRKNENTAG